MDRKSLGSEEKHMMYMLAPRRARIGGGTGHPKIGKKIALGGIASKKRAPLREDRSGQEGGATENGWGAERKGEKQKSGAVSHLRGEERVF